MKIEINFAKHISSLQQIKRIMEIEDISKTIISIIDSKTDIGREIVNYKGQTIFTIKLKGKIKES